MSIHSMTGHGRAEALFKGVKITLELQSVNHRQFDLRMDMPQYLFFMETELRRIIHKAIARGSVLCRCHVESGGETALQRVFIDDSLARQYLRAAGRRSARLKIKNDLTASALFNLPGVVKLHAANVHIEHLADAVVSVLRRALASLCAMRSSEGRALAAEIRRRMKRLENILQKVQQRLPAVHRFNAAKLRKLLIAASNNPSADKKIIREIIAVADRCNIAEELERSASHLRQLARLLEAKEPVGRTLDFLVQEMMREINTIGSKANDCLISNQVIKYKSELECIREQAQNIE